MFCKECGSTVTKSDRFCPACGTPNVMHKFHPKFGPGIMAFEPRIITEVAPAGSPSCPRCHRLIEKPHEYCVGCGLGLDETWDRHDRVTVLNAWREKSGLDMEQYHHLRWLSEPLMAVLSIGVVVATALGLTNLWLYARGEGSLSDGPDTAGLWRVLDTGTLVAVVLFVLGGGLTVVWLWRAYLNLPALAVGDLRFASFWAVLGWIVPGYNLFRPKQILDDVWRGSHPYAPPFSSSWRLGPVPAWSAAWWCTAWLGVLAAIASHILTPAEGAINHADAQSSLALAGVAGLLLGGSALCLQLLVRRVRERQELRAAIVLAEEPDEEEEVAEPEVNVEGTSLMREQVTMEDIAGKY